MTTRKVATACALATALCAVHGVVHAGDARAQGFGLNEIGSCAIARGFATTSAPCDDASTIYWNPGYATRLPGLSVYGGATAVHVNGAFTQDITQREFKGNVPTRVPPFLGVNWTGDSTSAFSRLALGVAFYVPYGLTSQWGDDFIGRFSALKASLSTYYIQPNIAFDVVPGRLTIGGGPVFAHSSLELRRAIDFSSQPSPVGVPFAQLGFAPGTEFARVQLKGSGSGVGFNVGAHAQVTPTLAIGVRYLSKVRIKYDGATADFTPSDAASAYVLPAGNALGVPGGTTLAQVTASQFASTGALHAGQTASSQLDHPAQFQIGLAYTGFDSTTLSLDYGMIQYSSFKTLPIDFGAGSPLSSTLIEDYKDAHSVRAGFEHRVSGLATRLGFSYVKTPAPAETVTPLLPDMDRYNFAAGLGIPLARDRATLDASYLRVETQGRRGRTGERASESQTAAQLNNGWYALNANIFSASLKLNF